MSAPEVITFGCRLNTFESEVMRRNAAAAGLSDVVIVNTCAVTAEAERQARQAIRKARREHPVARILVTGCAAEIRPDAYRDMAEVDGVIANATKLAADAFGAPGAKPNEIAALPAGGFAERARAYVEVQNGCDHRCTFCIIPYGRGPSRSVAAPEVVVRVRRLVHAGVREVVLTGVDVTAYGGDLPGGPRLGDLVREVLAAVPELERLRLTSLDPAEVDEALWEAIASEERLMPHLHLSLQAGDDLILKRMKRRHSRAGAVAFAARARAVRPDVALGADLIAGFPTESGDAFARTLSLVDDCGLAYLHVFPYSARDGTPAARMPAVPRAEVKERAARLRAKGNDALAAHLAARVGGTGRVLVEQAGPDGALGKAEDYAPVRLNADAAAVPGTVVAARFVAAESRRLVGRLHP